MGLSAPRKRQKISHDPNNTHWTKDTTSFGHKILSSQGWSPGSTLGAASASHASHYTAASSSHIRVALKDDNLGLGARRGKESEDTFGLSQLAGIYGRLNGKTDERLAKEEEARREVGNRLYVEQKFGGMRFVRGGLLVGDRIEEKVEDVSPVAAFPLSTVKKEDPEGVKKEDEGEGKPVLASAETSHKKRRKERRDQDSGVKVEIKTEEDEDEQLTPSSLEDAANTTNTANDSNTLSAHRKASRRKEREAKALVKEVRRAEKIERRQRKEERRARRAKKDVKVEEVPQAPVPTPQQAALQNHLAVRQRFIRQKRMASMDPTALREILMLKA